MTAVRRRELLRRIVDAPPDAEEERPAPEQPTPPTYAAGDPAFDYFGSFAACHELIEAGYPVVRGTAKHRSRDPVYLGNGDTIEFADACSESAYAKTTATGA